MRKVLKFVALAAVLGLFAACFGSSSQSSQEANKKNFKSTLNLHLQKRGITITVTDKFPIQCVIEQLPDPTAKRPIVPRLKSNRGAEKYEMLEKLGYLTSKESIIEEEDLVGFGVPKKLVKYKVRDYEPTDKAKKLLIAPDEHDRNYRLKIGRLKVDEIQHFTAPTAKDGYTFCHVQYTCSPADVEKEFTKPEVERVFFKMKTKLQPNQSSAATLVLMNDGWRHTDELLGMIRRTQ